MPVLLQNLSNPTDLVIQGELLRTQALSYPVDAPGLPVPMVVERTSISAQYPFVTDDETAIDMQGADWDESYMTTSGKFWPEGLRVHAVIAAPTGALIPIPYARALMGAIGSDVPSSTSRWQVSGVTRDSGGAALANCRVVLLETGRIAMGATPVVAETVSDGSGTYVMEVPLNTTYQAIAYKPGSPDVAGITRNDLTPVAV